MIQQKGAIPKARDNPAIPRKLCIRKYTKAESSNLHAAASATDHPKTWMSGYYDMVHHNLYYVYVCIDAILIIAYRFGCRLLLKILTIQRIVTTLRILKTFKISIACNALRPVSQPCPTDSPASRPYTQCITHSLRVRLKQGGWSGAVG